MKFEFEKNITEQDYINFNKFYAMNTEFGKKTNRLTKTIVIVTILLIILLLFLIGYKVGIIGGSILLLATIVTFFRINKIILSSVEKNVKNLKKSGKLPYSPCSVLEFGEEVFCEIEEKGKLERKYSVIENVSISNEYETIYIFISSATAVILPYSVFKSREEMFAFIDFIKLKCPKVLYF